MDRKRNVVVGVFHERGDADNAVAALRKAGFSESSIGVVARNVTATGTNPVVAEGSNMASGAAWGAAAGLGAGGLVGLGVLAGVIPVIGPVIAGGALATILANAAGGAVIGGLVGSLAGLGIPEEEARYYEEEVKSGRYLVTVKDGRAGEAEAILCKHNAYDFHRRQESAVSMARKADSREALTDARSVTGGEKLQLAEEELRAHKTQEKVGEVRVRKEVVTEQQTLTVPVRREEVVIERHAASGQRTGDLQPGQEIRIPVMEEQVSVEKHAVVKEEVKVGKRQIQENKQVSGTVRKEEIKVEQTGDVEVRTSGTPSKKRDDNKK
jgi:uncharacterized protein (TIGR02271 family)